MFYRKRAFACAVGATLLLAIGGCQGTAAKKQAALKRGDDFAAQKKYPEAGREYKKALQLDARYGEAYWHLAQTYEQAGDLANAVVQYVRAADILTDNRDVQVKAANGLLHVCGVVFILARAIHAAGLSRSGGRSVGRSAGIMLTWAVLVVLAVWNIVAFLRPALA